MTGQILQLIDALDNLVGPGAQHERTCDAAEHGPDGACIWCEARSALADARAAGGTCDECGQHIPTIGESLVNRHHDPACSLHGAGP